MPDNRGFVGSGIDRAIALEKSPTAEGFVAGLKAALIGAPMAAGIQALRGKDPVLGAILGAAVPGILAGIARASVQKIENLDSEANLRYHAQKIKEREPAFFLPPRQYMGRYFSERYRK